MLCFFDKDNKSISRERWQRLYRDRTYNPVLARQKGNGWEIEASWVGVFSTTERNPCAFLVRTMSLDLNNGSRQSLADHPDVWCATPQEAKEVAARKLLELCRKSFSE